ncbi:MAG: VOC family protein [Candidatus Binatia bacterium]|nr:VOC family protein [Candidatus Binatia bacterium]
MSATKPALKSLGMRHLALRVCNLDRALWFYCDMLGFSVVWQPDPENVYLSSGCDSLALHRADAVSRDGGPLDHLGILVGSAPEVGEAEAALEQAGVTILQGTKTHRDDSVSCYVADPDGNSVQILFEPTISPIEVAR